MRIKPIMVTTGIYPCGDYRSEEYKTLAPLTVSDLTGALDAIKMLEEKKQGDKK